MKKNIIALAVASAIAAPVAMADAPVVYGKVNVNLNSTTDKGVSANDTASRIGVKGSEDLGNGLKAVYKMEWDVDVAASGAVKGRNQYLGLAGGFGTVLIGSHDTPLKMSQPSDLFNDGAADAKPFAGGLGYDGDAGEVRPDHVFAYVSPTFSGVKLVAAGVTALSGKDSGLGNITSIAAMYGSTKKGLFLSAAVNNFDAKVSDKAAVTASAGPDGLDGTEDDKIAKAAVAGDDITETRVSAQYKTGGLIANVMWQDFNGDSIIEGTNVQANIGYKMGKFMPKAKYSSVNYKDKAVKDGSAYAVGLNYSLGKKTTAYVYVADFSKHMGDKTSTIVGMVHKF
jgi:predicted porin